VNPTIRPEIFAKLAACDSSSIANAVDAAGVRLANEGFNDNRIKCMTERLLPMVGQVVTLKVRSADPPMKKAFYLEHPDWWEILKVEAFPRVLAIEDVDARPGRGSAVGPVHACILKALGFVGVITNGAIRGRSSLERIGLWAFAGNVAPAHAYSHVIATGVAVEIAGMRLSEGDLVHGDESGVVVIPTAIAGQVAESAERFHEREKRVCEFCRSAEFSPSALRAHIGVDESRR